MDEARRSHLSGFDWLRAFMSVAVVLWHGHAFGMSELFGKEFALPYRPRASDLLDFNLLLVAVPTFITIACFLYRRGMDAPNALSRRLRRLGLLLCVWTIIHLLFHGGYPNLARRIASLDGWDWWRFVSSGGASVYYYFFSQIVALLIASIALRLPKVLREVLFPLGLLMLLMQLSLRLGGGHWMWTAHFNPLNFVPCALAVAALPRDLEHRSARFKVGLALGLLLVAVILAMIEWRLFVSPLFFPSNSCGFPPYTRPSIVLTSLAVVLASLALHRPAPGWVRFMSRHSLALYCLHPLLFSILATHFSSTFLVGDQWQWYACVPVILGSYLLSILLQRAVFKRGILS